MPKQLTRRDVMTKALGIEFKNAPCGCDSCAPVSKQADPELAAKVNARARPLTWVEQLALDASIREFEEREAAYKAGRPPQIGREVPAPLIAGDGMLCEALEAATKDLGIPWLRLRYFAEPANVNGLFNPIFPDAVWLRSNRSSWDQLATLGHELWHAYRGFTGGPRHDEAGARRYGAKLRDSDPRGWKLGLVRPRLFTESGERL